MMDKLEKFMIENRDDFNLYEPGSGVWDKIQNSIEKPEVKRVNLRYILWRAAIVLVIFGSAFTLSEILHWRKNDNVVSEQKLMKKIPQLAEAEAYYSFLSKTKLNEINSKLSNDPELQKKILKDVKELDNMSEALKKDLYDNVATQEVVEAMIQNYRLKLEILEEILSDLHKRDKTNEHESKQYEL